MTDAQTRLQKTLTEFPEFSHHLSGLSGLLYELNALRSSNLPMNQELRKAKVNAEDLVSLAEKYANLSRSDILRDEAINGLTKVEWYVSKIMEIIQEQTSKMKVVNEADFAALENNYGVVNKQLDAQELIKKEEIDEFNPAQHLLNDSSSTAGPIIIFDELRTNLGQELHLRYKKEQTGEVRGRVWSNIFDRYDLKKKGLKLKEIPFKVIEDGETEIVPPYTPIFLYRGPQKSWRNVIGESTSILCSDEPLRLKGRLAYALCTPEMIGDFNFDRTIFGLKKFKQNIIKMSDIHLEQDADGKITPNGTLITKEDVKNGMMRDLIVPIDGKGENTLIGFISKTEDGETYRAEAIIKGVIPKWVKEAFLSKSLVHPRHMGLPCPIFLNGSSAKESEDYEVLKIERVEEAPNTKISMRVFCENAFNVSTCREKEKTVPLADRLNYAPKSDKDIGYHVYRVNKNGKTSLGYRVRGDYDLNDLLPIVGSYAMISETDRFMITGTRSDEGMFDSVEDVLRDMTGHDDPRSFFTKLPKREMEFQAP